MSVPLTSRADSGNFEWVSQKGTTVSNVIIGSDPENFLHFRSTCRTIYHGWIGARVEQATDLEERVKKLRGNIGPNDSFAWGNGGLILETQQKLSAIEKSIPSARFFRDGFMHNLLGMPTFSADLSGCGGDFPISPIDCPQNSMDWAKMLTGWPEIASNWPEVKLRDESPVCDLIIPAQEKQRSFSSLLACQELERKHPELFHVLQHYYKLIDEFKTLARVDSQFLKIVGGTLFESNKRLNKYKQSMQEIANILFCELSKVQDKVPALLKNRPEESREMSLQRREALRGLQEVLNDPNYKSINEGLELAHKTLASLDAAIQKIDVYMETPWLG